VYAKRPFSSPTCVLKYLARYTHGVAISNRRLVALHDGQVSFRYKDYADRQQSKILTLQTPEFIRRFLLHTLPRSFVRIRYYGFLANRQRNERLEHCRRLLGVTPVPAEATSEKVLHTEADPREPCQRCPACQHGKLVIIEIVSPVPRLQPRRPHILTSRAAFAKPLDSS
jgi:Putative transposase